MHPVRAIDSYWALEADKFAGMMAMLDRIGPDLLARSAESMLAASVGEKRPYDVNGRVAVVSLSGVMTKQDSFLSWLFGGASTQRTIGALAAAANDPAIDSILLKVDSPGGQVDGTYELAQAVKRAGGEKRLVAFADDNCCSAAYWAASQASEIWCSPTTILGSIGCLMVIEDESEAAASAGIKVWAFGSGEMKSAGTPGTAITEAQAKYFQGLANNAGALFQDAVREARGLDDAQMALVSKAGVFRGQEAVDAGLADGVCSFSECLDRLCGGLAPRSSLTAMPGSGEGVTGMNLLEKAKEKLGLLPETASAEDIRSAFLEAGLITDAKAPAPAAVAASVVMELPEEVKTALSIVPMLQAENVELKGKLIKMGEAMETQATSDFLKVAEARVDAAIPKKVTPDGKEALLTMARERGKDAFESAMAFVEAQPDRVEVVGKLIDAASLLALDGGTSAAAVAHERAMTLMETKKGLSYESAYKQVTSMDRSLAAKIQAERDAEQAE